jgi:septum site-determining protein MinD
MIMRDAAGRKGTIISVVSGKGGTGKTLLCAVLAELLGNRGVSVLLIDLDIFVRGLTTLLYYHKGETLVVTEPGEDSVSDYFARHGQRESESRSLGLSRCRSFDVMPSVSRVDEILDFRGLVPDCREGALGLLVELVSDIPDRYDIIFLDSRAGYDELISAGHKISDVTISVEEDDQVSRITADNLVRQLEADSNRPVFRVTNKARSIRNLEDLDEEARAVTDLGQIPFDIDVMRSFGTDRFWTTITRSLFTSALIRVWNRLSKKMGYGVELKDQRMSPVASEAIERQISLLGSRGRVFFVYGILIAILGLSFALAGETLYYEVLSDPLRAAALFAGLAGLALALLPITRIFKRR